MLFDADDEILQDFLIEAGEMVETLNEELVALEQRPEDSDLLNSVFRIFHTIKGGAGFLALTSLVELCHRAEDVFNLLRNGELVVDARIMDVMLPVLDQLNDTFDKLRNGIEPGDADPAVLSSLDAILTGELAADPVVQTIEAKNTPAADEVLTAEGIMDDEDVTDEEFESLLDALDEPPSETNTSDNNVSDTLNSDNNVSNNNISDTIDSEKNASVAEKVQPEVVEDDGFELFDMGDGDSSELSEDISEDEFEDLLDQLHGDAKFNNDVISTTATADSYVASEQQKPVAKKTVEEIKPLADDEISDAEFEDLLDDIHGAGKFGEVPVSTMKHQAPSSGKESSTNKKTEPSAVEHAAAVKKNPAPSPSPASAAAPKAKAKKVEPAASAPILAEATVRVDTKRLDDIMNMVGELVLVRNRLVTLDQALGNEEMSKAVSSLDVVTADLQMSVMKTRMQPIKKVFGRFPRVVRDLSRNMNKEVLLELVGEETDLDKNLVEALADSLVHLVRNSVDHGIEMPDEREKMGKPRQGRVILTAEQEGDHIMLSIEDDGAGMNADKLRALAVKKDLMDQETADRLDDKECYNLIFMPGFSTKDEISDVSGRGVGMDVVKTRIAQLNGSVDIDSEEGKGTRIAIKVPLTLAIMPTLMVKLKDQAFALPLVSVNEIFHLDLTKTNTVDGQSVIMIRDKPLPLFYLTQWLIKGCEQEKLPDEGHVVVVHVGTKKVGFVVNHLIGQEEVVIKPLGSLLQGTAGLSGATITGDGKIALILDVPTLMSSHVG